VHDREPTTRVQREPRKLEPLIQWLENDADFVLQEFTLKLKIDTALQAFYRTLCEHNQGGSQKTKTFSRMMTCTRSRGAHLHGSEKLTEGSTNLGTKSCTLSEIWSQRLGALKNRSSRTEVELGKEISLRNPSQWRDRNMLGCRSACVIPNFMPKSSTHRMHDPGSIILHIRPKVLTDNQMSQI
jgi:hypothetical protein